jgi:hypothetical protein
MHMQVPSGFIIPFFLVSFVMLSVQYYRLNPDRRVFNAQFSLMMGAVALTFADIFQPQWALIYFVLGLCWLGLTIYLQRHMPPPRN